MSESKKIERFGQNMSLSFSKCDNAQLVPTNDRDVVERDVLDISYFVTAGV